MKALMAWVAYGAAPVFAAAYEIGGTVGVWVLVAAAYPVGWLSSGWAWPHLWAKYPVVRWP